jgi:sorbitol/mannitol transport system permease protein
MATQHSRSAARLMMAPAVILLLGWMLVPLTMTLYFSFKKYLPMRGDSLERGLDWVGFENYARFITVKLVLAQRADHADDRRRRAGDHRDPGHSAGHPARSAMWGQGVVRILVIAPFFVMPTVSALVWKNMFMDPVNGMFAHLWRFFGAEPVSWLSPMPRCRRSS